MTRMGEQIRDLVDGMLRPIRTRIYTMISRAVVEFIRKDDTGMQVLKLQALALESRDGVEHFQPFGFGSVPPPGSEALVVCPGGNRSHMVAVVVDERVTRLKTLVAGEAALYNQTNTAIVHVKATGEVEISGAVKVKLNTPAVELGPAAIEAVIKGNTFQALFNAHTHIGSTAGNQTSPPVQQLTGTELSAVSKTT